MAPEVVEIPLSTPLKRLDGHVLLELEDRYVVLQRQGRYLSWDGAGHHYREGFKDFSPERSLGELAGLALRQEPRRAFILPRGRVVSVPAWFGGRRWIWPLVILLATTAMVVVLILLLSSPVTGVVGVLGVVALMLLATGFLGVVASTLFSGTRVMYWTAWRRWEFAELAAIAGQDDLATRQVTAVKEEYGRLLTDLMYRIQNPALFDATCPTTEPFQLALVEWDGTAEHLGTAGRSALASRVVATFRHARHHAEQVGMGHLPRPARRAAKRAVKALRVATNRHATETERVTALERAVALLDGLVLHHLPTGAEIRQAVGTQHRRELPGRRST